MKGAFDFTTFDVEYLGEYAVSCAHAPAHSMAKAGDPALLSGYVGKSDAFDEAIVQFALPNRVANCLPASSTNDGW